MNRLKRGARRSVRAFPASPIPDRRRFADDRVTCRRSAHPDQIGGVELPAEIPQELRQTMQALGVRSASSR